ncbi:MAG: TetR/AcrR family transcriptional regulator [Wenzhouxiangellaceae bacterium]
MNDRITSVSGKALNKAQRRRRDDIIEAALAVFDRDGFDGARIDDVAAEAEVAKGTVYLYFKNKQALFEAMIEAVVGPAIDAVERAASSSDSTAAERLRLQIRVIGERLGKGSMKSVLRLMISEGPRHDELRRYYYQRVVRPGMVAIRHSLEQGENSGEFRRGSASLHPQIFAGPALMAAVWRMLFDDMSPLDVESLLQEHLEIVLRGLRA